MFQEIISHLLRNKLRTSLTGLSVSVGIFLLIFLLGAGNGLIHAFDSNSGSFAMDVVQVWPGRTSMPFDGLERGRRTRFDERDVTGSQQALPQNILAATGNLSASGKTLYYQDHCASSSLVGVYPLQADLDKIKIIAGRFINDLDMSDARKSIVITESLAKEFYGTPAKAIGKGIRVDSLNYTIVGVRANRGDFGEAKSHVPYTTMQVAYTKGTDIEQLNFRVQGAELDAEKEAFENGLRRSIASRHRFDPKDQEAIWIWNASSGAKEHAVGMGILQTALWIIGLLTLLSGVVSISNIMLITVKERTHEFGILKALGARPWSILRSVLLESVIITTFFGYIGLVAGVAATEYLNYSSGEMVMEFADQKMYTFLDPTVDLRIALMALAILIVAGLIAGFFPARKAVKVKPIEALNAR